MYAGMPVRSLISNVKGTLIFVLENESLVEYRARTVYGMITVREWFQNCEIVAA